MWGTIVAVLVRRPPRGPAADARAVTRQIRRLVWPRLGDAGFEAFTGRNAWRYVGDDVNLVSQPWFQPFRQDVRRWALSFRLHREGLKRVLRTETHDRSDTWFVLPDGSNLDECVEDALAAIEREGLPWFESLRERSDQPQ
jgi:hypothetical protein